MAGPEHRRSARLIAALGVIVAVVGILATLYYVSARFDDSGVNACEVLAERGRTAAATSDTPMTRDDYKKLREVFEDSNREDIRRNGIAFIDITWQTANMKEDDPLVMLYAQQIVSSYTDLSTACANNGVVLPSLKELSDARNTPSPSST